MAAEPGKSEAGHPFALFPAVLLENLQQSRCDGVQSTVQLWRRRKLTPIPPVFARIIKLFRARARGGVEQLGKLALAAVGQLVRDGVHGTRCSGGGGRAVALFVAVLHGEGAGLNAEGGVLHGLKRRRAHNRRRCQLKNYAPSESIKPANKRAHILAPSKKRKGGGLRDLCTRVGLSPPNR